MNPELDAVLDQRGRASVDFLANLMFGSRHVRAAVDAETKRLVPDPDTLPDDLDERHQQLQQGLSDARAWRVAQLLSEWQSRMHGRVASEAFDEISARMAPVLGKYAEGTATLEAAPDHAAPDYWDGVNFHRTSGGWDGHPYQGYIHGEIVHRKMIDRVFLGGGIFKTRLRIANRAPRDRYGTILDMGCSTGHFTAALQQAYPNAEIHGVDLSLRTLEQAQRFANANGWAWKLYQRPAEATGFADETFDLAASYILLHELPADAIRAVFAEAFRVLKPGGDLIMSDVTRYADMDKLSQWKADAGARYGGEPHWRESASLDLGQVARDAGFVDVTAEGEQPMQYPYVVTGRKPA